MTKGLRKACIMAPLLTAQLVCGCATTDGYKKVVNAWVEQPETELIEAWGTPQRIYETETAKILIYYSQRFEHIAGSPSSYTNYWDLSDSYLYQRYEPIPDQTYIYSCETAFEVINGVITSWSFRGNDCVAELEDE